MMSLMVPSALARFSADSTPHKGLELGQSRNPDLITAHEELVAL